MENDSEFEHVKMKGHRNSVVALVLALITYGLIFWDSFLQYHLGATQLALL